MSLRPWRPIRAVLIVSGMLRHPLRPHLGPDDLVALYGPEWGERMALTSGRAPDAVFALIDRHKIDCAPTRGGFLYVARTRVRLRSIEKLAEEWRQRGVDAVTLDRPATAAILGTTAYLGGYFDPRAGTIQPLSYTRGLAKAALRAGASVFAGVRAKSLRRNGGRWLIETSQGPMSAPTVIIATNAYTTGLIGRLSRSVLRIHSVQLATAPIPEEIRRTILPAEQSCSDNHADIRYFRWDQEGRFVLGGPGWFTPPRTPNSTSFRRLERSLKEMFPQLRTFDVAHRWFGAGALTLDTIPHLHEPRPGIFAALGYNGRGIALGTVRARGASSARRSRAHSSVSPNAASHASVQRRIRTPPHRCGFQSTVWKGQGRDSLGPPLARKRGACHGQDRRSA